MVGDLPWRLVAEAIGTMLLVLFGAGAVVAALLMGRGTLTYAALGFVSLPFAVVIALVIYAFGSTSGAHINPAVAIPAARSPEHDHIDEGVGHGIRRRWRHGHGR
ncbi:MULTISPECIES: aquaporin [unclassified Nonomuraea]|uniref:aquaporin n=1 Tax=unclassified Nonomuraea TaxID=2593643 RepID=UPI0033D41392